VTALLILLGPADPEHALRQALEGAELARGPADLGELLDAQLAASRPLDAYVWETTGEWSAIRLRPGGLGGLEPELPRALSTATGGLVLAMEAARTRDRYLLGAFLAGQSLELHRCVEGVAEGPRGRELCEEDAVVAEFSRWLTPLVGAVDPHSLGVEPAGALLATGAALDATPETGRMRTAWREDGRTQVLETDGEAAPDPRGDVAVMAVPGGGAPVRWRRLDGGEEVEGGVADGYEQLAATLPAWALRAPG
jgi:hypothetical protein